MPEAIILQNGTEQSRVSFSAPCLLSQLAEALPQPCGGRGYCGKCRIRAGGKLSLPTVRERAFLTERELASGQRLACQATALGDVCIVLPDKPNAVKASSALVQPVEPLGERYGFAIDLGTTTISAALYRLSTGEVCGHKNIPNPQSRFGADVLTRMERALHGDAQALSVCVRRALYDLCASLLIAQRLTTDDADAAVLVGNTAMLYLLFGLSTASIAVAPFRCDTRFGAFYSADFLPVRSGAQLFVPPVISAFLGADTTAAVLGSGLMRGGTRILCDLGTNGEMVLAAGNRLCALSCAAGPAFEGVGLSCGMPAVDGAVHTVLASGGRLVLRTVADAPPVGLCGSGVVDLIACLVRIGALQRDGKLTLGAPFGVDGTPICLTQQDVRAFQLAKSAVRCGLEVLCRQTDDNVASLLLAGTFGSALHPDSAAAVGLFPPVLRSVVTDCGNAAGTGAAMLLLDRGKIAEAERVAQHTETLPLAELPDFQNMLIQYTNLE